MNIDLSFIRENSTNIARSTLVRSMLALAMIGGTLANAHAQTAPDEAMHNGERDIVRIAQITQADNATPGSVIGGRWDWNTDYPSQIGPEELQSSHADSQAITAVTTTSAKAAFDTADD